MFNAGSSELLETMADDAVRVLQNILAASSHRIPHPEGSDTSIQDAQMHAFALMLVTRLGE
jgi:hypothetical protein